VEIFILLVEKTLKQIFQYSPKGLKYKMKKYKDTGCGINKIETTNATLSNRGGLAFILRYIESIHFFNLIEETLHSLCLHSKGKKASFIIRQLLAFLIDGLSEQSAALIRCALMRDMRRFPAIFELVSLFPKRINYIHNTRVW
jgi:hypothetical protein